MTSSSPSSAPSRKLLSALALAALFAVAGCGKSDGSGEYADAVKAYESRDLAKAERLFAKSSTLSQSNVDALVMLAAVRLELGEMDAAKDAVSSAVALAPNDMDVIELQAQVAWHAEDYQRARSLYLRLAADRRADVALRSRALAGLGVVDMTLADRDKTAEWLRDRARTEFMQALALDYRNAAALYHLAYLYRYSYEAYNEGALSLYKRFASFAPVVDERVKKVQKTFIPELTAAIDASIASIPGASNRNATAGAAALKRAEEAWKAGKYKTAKLRYDEALKADPLSYEAACGLAAAWLKTDTSAAGQRKAYECYRRACRLKPIATDTHIAAADLAYALSRHASAADLYSRAITSRPRDLTAIDGLIRSLRKSGNGKSADVYQRYRDAVARK